MFWVFQPTNNVDLSLTNLLTVVWEPWSWLHDNVLISSQIDHFTSLWNSLTKQDFNFHFTEWCCNLVLHNLDTGNVTNWLHIVTVSLGSIDTTLTTNVQTYWWVELQCTSTRCRFWVTKHDTNLFTQLVDKDCRRTSLQDSTWHLTQSLWHHTGLQTDSWVTNFTVDFGLRRQSGNWVDNNHVDGTWCNQGIRNGQSLFTSIWLW